MGGGGAGDGLLSLEILPQRWGWAAVLGRSLLEENGIGGKL
jgi:hypothetical protein